MESAKGSAKFVITPLEACDADAFVSLQDQFAEEHLSLTRCIYPKVCLRDWQLSLLCPQYILDEDGARTKQVVSMIQKEEKLFENLSIYKAITAGLDSEGCEGSEQMVGYIMFQYHEGGRRKVHGRGRGRGCYKRQGPWVQVKQLFVIRSARGRGCGHKLFTSALEVLPGNPMESGGEDVRLSCLDLNTRATKWYRRAGLVVAGLNKEFLGEPEDANLIVYQVMRRRKKIEGPPVPIFFKSEVCGEVVRIDYPDNSEGGAGSFVVRVDSYDSAKRWHCVDSCGLSLWDGEVFTDVVNLNEFFRDGRVEFSRHLSLILRDVELSKRETKRKAKAVELAAAQSAKRKRITLVNLESVSPRLTDVLNGSSIALRSHAKKPEPPPAANGNADTI